jgi:CelD/BcsL family acetyltransferase involved in cellulose biosynthesis
MREAASAGALRLGLLHAGPIAIAAQLWIVADSTASVLKLAHDEAHKALSPGTILTARMIAHLLDTERVAALDFGRGDDPYKQLWTTNRRQRIGLFLASPWHPTGAATLLRQSIGAFKRRVAG